MFRRTLRPELYDFVGGPDDGLSKEAYGARKILYFSWDGDQRRQMGVYRKKRWRKTYYWEDWIYV